jgi:hypothetical protein
MYCTDYDGVARRLARAAAVSSGDTPRQGDRVQDGGQRGTLVRCPQCSGDGLLLRLDPEELERMRAATPEPSGDTGQPATAAEEDDECSSCGHVRSAHTGDGGACTAPFDPDAPCWCGRFTSPSRVSGHTPDAVVAVVWDHTALAYAVKVSVADAPVLLTRKRFWEEAPAREAAAQLRALLGVSSSTPTSEENDRGASGGHRS